jgi:glutamate N-acetyltransferase/amino-acid N-acetyltransferase
MIELAHDIVRDGEGATKFVEVRIEGGASEAACDQVARTIAHSPLVKTALFASDPNWGRLLMAIGRAGVENLNTSVISIHINGVLIAEEGARAASYTEEAGSGSHGRSRFTNRGESESRIRGVFALDHGLVV